MALGGTRRGLAERRTVLAIDLPRGTRLGGVSEIAEACGVGRAAVCNWRARHDMPAPLVELASGSVWDLDEVLRWWSER